MTSDQQFLMHELNSIKDKLEKLDEHRKRQIDENRAVCKSIEAIEGDIELIEGDINYIKQKLFEDVNDYAITKRITTCSVCNGVAKIRSANSSEYDSCVACEGKGFVSKQERRNEYEPRRNK